mmetsp:Transcript_15679/g.34078  ORF Transcript_15679/g.34078 Transcript_15679/m.34078 type:complete len:202 (-) Transcript_15679:3719-4324(-)
MSLGSDLLGGLVLQIPNTILVRCRRRSSAATHNARALCRKRLNTNLKATHVKEQVWIVRAKDANEGVVPIKCRDASRESILNVPKYGPAQIDIALKQPHAAIAWPAFLVPVTYGVFVVWIRMFNEVALDEILPLSGIKLEQNVDLVHVPRVQANGMTDLRFNIGKSQILIGTLRCTGKLTGPRETEDKQIKNEAIVLNNKT